MSYNPDYNNPTYTNPTMRSNLNENQGTTATGLNEPDVRGAGAPVGTSNAPLGTTSTGHQGLHTAEAAGVAGLAGHEFEKHTGHHGHHYGPDAAIGAGVLEHERHKHQNQQAGTYGEKPSMGDKIAGKMKKAAGKITGDQTKVMEGDQLAHGNRVL